MIDNLLEKGIKKETLSIIKGNETLNYNLTINLDDVLEVIDYFKGIGINNIDDLLIYNPDIFMASRKEVEKKFEQYDINNLVNSINEDVENIDIIYE